MAKIWTNKEINTAINAVYNAYQDYYLDNNEIEPSQYGREVVSFAMVRKSLRSRKYATVHPLYFRLG